MTSPENTSVRSTSTATIEQKTADTTDRKVYTPASNPGAVFVGAVWGVALLGLAALAIRDLLIRAGWVDSTEWLTAPGAWIDGLSWSTWMWPVAVVLIIVGLWLLWVAVRPRRKTHVSVAGFEVLWTRRGDIARRCSTAVSAIPHVEHATTVVGRRKVKVTVTTDSDDLDVATVEHVVNGVLSGIDLSLRPSISVRRRHSERGGQR